MVKSTQTKYRERKVEIIIEILNLLIKLVILKKKQLQRVNLAFFKKIKIDLENAYKQATSDQ